MGRFGIREPRKELPCAPAHLLADRDLAWIVPGVAFDETGGRLGRGRGYYDRMLRDVLGIKVGVGYDWQVVPCLPSSSHDVRMDVIVTNSRILRCHGRLAPTRPC
jgi:5-formyltetrahydrofolate cyclo-ligase